MPRLIVTLLTVVALSLAARPALGDGEGSGERWYIVQMQGQRAGWMREAAATAEGQIRSESEMSLTIKRGDLGIKIKVESRFVETEDGKPVSMRSVMQLGALPTTTEYTFKPDGVEVATFSGKAKEPTSTQTQPLPTGEWLTPRAAERKFEAAIAAGEKEISLRSVDPLTGLKPITTTHTLVERTALEVIGKTVPALKWKSIADAYPDLVSTAFTDEQGAALRTETDVGGIKLTVIRADKDLAKAKLDPPELLMSTLIRPDRPIENPRTLRRAVYTLTSTGEKLPDIVSVGAQRFERTGETTGRITVDLDRVAAAPEGEVADASFTDCSSMVSCDDEDVKRLAREALKKAGLDGDTLAPAAAERAEALRAFVYRYINKKSLGVGFASAAEVADTRTGDCSEHGVLLAALLRANGIPARVVSGLVYVDGFAGEQTVFGYHMWAQALLEVDGQKRWVDLDAALSADEPSDATHIALAPTSLSEDDTTNSLVKLAPLIGTLKISVEEPK